MIAVILALLIVPLTAGIACAVLPAKLAPAITVVSGVACFAGVLVLIPAVTHRDLNYLSYLRVDAVSAIFLLATGFLYASVAVYSVGYLSHNHGEKDFARYSRRFYAGLNLFAGSMLAARSFA